MRQRLEEKNRMIEKKTQAAMQAQQERNRMNTELTEIKDHMDIKDRKINVLQRKVSRLSYLFHFQFPCSRNFLPRDAIVKELRRFALVPSSSIFNYFCLLFTLQRFLRELVLVMFAFVKKNRAKNHLIPIHKSGEYYARRLPVRSR